MNSRATDRPLPRAVFFDMDDTIFDHARTCRAAIEVVRSEDSLFRPRTLNELWREYYRLLDSVHSDILEGKLSVERARRERFRRLAMFCGTSISDDDAQSLSNRYRAAYQSLRRAVPGARALLERLRGRTTIGIVSNNQVAEQVDKLEVLGLRDLIDLLVISEEVGVAKPDPRIFRTALERARSAPGEAVMIGDSWANDIVGARAVGLRAVWFNRFRTRNPDPSVVPEITTLRDTARIERLLAAPGRPAPRRARLSAPP